MIGNAGPHREVWLPGDRIFWHSQKHLGGVVTAPDINTPERNASQQTHIWVRWDDDSSSYANPNDLDR